MRLIALIVALAALSGCGSSSSWGTGTTSSFDLFQAFGPPDQVTVQGGRETWTYSDPGDVAVGLICTLAD